MQTIFSYIIQKRFSRVNKDVATDALAYVLETSESARRGMMKLLRGIVPSLPSLLFRTQEMEGTIRPDLWGFSETEPLSSWKTSSGQVLPTTNRWHI